MSELVDSASTASTSEDAYRSMHHLSLFEIGLCVPVSIHSPILRVAILGCS